MPDIPPEIDGALTGPRKDLVGIMLAIQARATTVLEVLRNPNETDVEAAGTVGGKLRAGRDLWREGIALADALGKRK